MTDYSELKRLAEAAEAGQLSAWNAFVPDGVTVNPIGSALLLGPRRQDLDRMVAFACEDAYFIAAANPAAVLELIAENERLEADNGSMRGSTKRMGENASKMQRQLRKLERERDQLRAENEGMRRDAERYRWLRTLSPWPEGYDQEVDKGMCREVKA